MAAETVLAVDDFTGPRSRDVFLIVTLALVNAGGDQPDGAQGTANLEDARKGHAGV
jgi:hypothetical protein